MVGGGKISFPQNSMGGGKNSVYAVGGGFVCVRLCPNSLYTSGKTFLWDENSTVS